MNTSSRSSVDEKENVPAPRLKMEDASNDDINDDKVYHPLIIFLLSSP
jgi:hypothetical protein